MYIAIAITSFSFSNCVSCVESLAGSHFSFFTPSLQNNVHFSLAYLHNILLLFLS